MSSVIGRCGRARRVRGAAGIEFALAFPLLFGIFYAIVGYGLTMMLAQSMHFAAEEGARAAVALDWTVPCPPPTDSACIATNVNSVVNARVAEVLAWLPAAMEATVLGSVDVSVNAANELTVVVAHPAYHTAGFIPVINLPLLGPVPAVPPILTATAVMSLGSGA